MSTDAQHASSSHRVEIPRVITRTGYFVLHFMEMCVVMCAAGMAPLSALLGWAGPLIGYSNLKTQFPELSTILLALSFTVVMVLWMRFRRHEWRATLEMASTPIVALPLVLGAAWFGVIPNQSLFGLECDVACAFMIIPMLFRLDHYTGRHTNHQKHMHSSHSAR